LGRRFYHEITSVFRRIIEHPLRNKQFDPPARRLFANGFPHAVLYVARPDAIWIIAGGVEQLMSQPVFQAIGFV
jgi:hypothetical protein